MLLRCDELQGCRVRHEPLLQLVAVAHLLEGGALGAVAAHDEVRVREAAAHLVKVRVRVRVRVRVKDSEG